MEIGEVILGMVVGVSTLCIWPCSEAADWGVSRGEYDVQEYFPVHHATRAGVCFVIVGDGVIPVCDLTLPM